MTSNANESNSIPSLKETEAEERYYMASSWALMRRRFLKHKLAVFGVVVLSIAYVLAIFAGFFSTADPAYRHKKHLFAPPTAIRIIHDGKLHRPFVYGLKSSRHPVTRANIFELDKEQIHLLKLFVTGYEYSVLGLFSSRIHLLGVEDPGVIFLFGTESLGRDMFSRVLHGARVSLSIGLVGVFLSFILGSLLGGLSGYFGGWVDMFLQRVIEFLQSIPTLPLWMGLAAAVPVTWPQTRTYFMITIILSILGWTGLARVVRGKLLQLRNEDYVMAAQVYGASDIRIITRHLLPGFMSYLIVHLTLAIPYMILGETALSFLGIGLRPPAVTWGVMLQQAQNVRTVVMSPWLLLPGLCVVIVVLCFNFVGDGLRDAADPYK